MDVLTPAERRGALLVALLLALGAGYDLWRSSRPLPVQGPDDGPGFAAPADDPDAREAWPGITDDTTGGSSGLVAVPAAASIDLNRASASELDALPGVGPVLAARIVAYREQQGPFRRREELMAVRGIGPRLYARLASRVTVRGDDPPAARPPRAAAEAGASR